MTELDRKILPKGWRWAKLWEVCQRPIPTHDPTRRPDAEFTYVDISGVDNQRKCIVEPKLLLGRDAPSRARQAIKAGDIILATTRPNLNAVALVPKELDNQICSTGFCVLRPIPELLSGDFLFFWVQHPVFVESLSDLVKGALYPAVTDNQVLTQYIPLPPLPEQERIAALLKQRLAAVARARKASEARLAAARALPAAYLKMAFETNPSKGWEFVRLEEVADLLPSKSIALGGDAEVNAITTACLTEEGFRYEGIKKAKMKSSDVDECIVVPGEVLIARVVGLID